MHRTMTVRAPLVLLAALAMLAWSAAAQEEGRALTQGAGAGAFQVPEPGDAPVVWDEPASDPMDADDPVGALLEMMSLRERVSQLMLVTLQGGPGPDAQDVRFIRENPPGGVIIPKVLRPKIAAEYVNVLRNAPIEMQGRVPLLVGANLFDLPRRGHGLRNTFAQAPSLMAVAAASDGRSADRLAALVAEHMDVMGFNLHMGPSLELAPAIPTAEGSIHYPGSDPEFATSAGLALYNALAERNVLTLPMGFPGGGGNRTGTNLGVLSTPRAVLMAEDLMAYAALIEAGAPLINVGNSLTPTLDDVNRPASFSPVVIQALLRYELGFEGVVVAGPLDEQAMARHYNGAEAALAALSAGADMLYWHEAGQRVARAIDTIVHRVGTGEFPIERIDNAARRVLQLKIDHGLLQRPRPSPRDAERLEQNRALLREAYEIERRSITLVQNRGNVLPLRDPASLPVGVTGVTGVNELYEPLQDYLDKVVRQRITSARHAGAIHDFEIRRLTSRSPTRTSVVVLTGEERADGQRELIHELRKTGAAVVVVFVGYPSRVPDLAEADAIVLAYGHTGSLSETMKAVADVLVGEAPLRPLVIEQDLRTAAGRPETFRAVDLLRAPAGVLPVNLREPFVNGLAVPYDPSKAIRRAEWRFGNSRRYRGLEVQYTFDAPGRYPVTLTVTDSKGDTVTNEFHIVVEDG